MHKDHIPKDFHFVIDFNDNGGKDEGFYEKMEQSHEKALTNLEEMLEGSLTNARESLESGDVELNFQVKMFESLDFMNQGFKCGKEINDTIK